MKKIEVKIGRSGDNYSCIADDAVLNGIVVATCKTLDGLKKQFQESLQFHIEGCLQDGNKFPDWLVNSQYDLVYTLEISALLRSFDGVVTRSAIARASGIKEKQIRDYASGYRVPRKQQKEKIIGAFHSIGKRMTSVELITY